MQAAMLLQHGCPIAPWDFVDMHRNLDRGAIHCQECVCELIDVTSPDTVGKQRCHGCGSRLHSIYGRRRQGSRKGKSFGPFSRTDRIWGQGISQNVGLVGGEDLLRTGWPRAYRPT